MSVTIACLDRARFLPAAIESALAQTYGNLEILIADDGSSDGSLRIAEAYAGRRPDVVRVFTHPGHAHRGGSATINRSLDEATGVYWSLLDSDDTWHPRKLEEQVEFLERHREVGGVYGHALCIDAEGRGRPDLGLLGHDITRAADPVERLVLANAMPATTVLACRSAVADTGRFDEGLLYSDWDFWLRLASRHRLGFMPRARAFYRVHDHNLSALADLERLRHRADVLLKLGRQASALGGALARPRTRALIELETAHACYHLNDEPAARAHLDTAFSTDPALAGDTPYLVRWLGDCRRRSPLRAPSRGAGFAAWILQRATEGDGDGLRAAVAEAVGTSAAGRWAHRHRTVAAHWDNRRRVLHAMARDPLTWRDRALLGAYVQTLVGTRILRRRGRPIDPVAGEPRP